MPFRRKVRGRSLVWSGALLVGSALLLPLFTVNAAREGILRTLQAGLGRTVTADAVHFHLLPLPGVELDNIRVTDAPEFGLEQLATADTLTARLRLGSLLRGHIVFGRIQLEGADINLVRNQDGRWNIAALLDRAPGGAAHAVPARAGGGSSRFPYVEWSDTRINFKLQQTKTRFYLAGVRGSLAQVAGGWRLQATFQPQRTDLNLSNTGDVTVDGRWQAAGAGLHGNPFELEVQLGNSYLAGSSALLLGHDGGVHGIVAAAAHVVGNGRQFQITGTVQAQSLRRWDLLPPPANVNASFAMTYLPGEDELRVSGIGDPGWKRLQLAGSVHSLFDHPWGDFTLALRRYPAADLLPLLLAVKAHLPADLRLSGVADAGAQGSWRTAGAGDWQGSGSLTITQLGLNSGGYSLLIPAAKLAWNQGRLQWPATAAELNGPDMHAPMRVSASLDRSGFGLSLSSPSVGADGVAELCRLWGAASPWPSRLRGIGSVQAELKGTWANYRGVGWSGHLVVPLAHFAAAADAGLQLRDATLTTADQGDSVLTFTAVLPTSTATNSEVDGTLRWHGPEPPQVDLHSRELSSAAVFAVLEPQASGLLGRVFGGGVPDWLRDFHGRGTVEVQSLAWHKLPVRWSMTFAAADGWTAPSLRLGLAGGSFEGHAALDRGAYQIEGAVRDVALGTLLESVGYGGRLQGEASGHVQVSSPWNGRAFDQVTASGQFDVARGQLRDGDRELSFSNMIISLSCASGQLTIPQVTLTLGGTTWKGSGVGRVEGQRITYQLHLQRNAVARTIAGQLSGELP